MANKTRADILAQIYEYVPQANVSSHNTLIDNLVDLAAEEISYRHNFRYFAISTPVTHDLLEGEYYVDESDFSFTNLKEIRFMQWIISSDGSHGRIKWKPAERFLMDHPFVDYSNHTTGKPEYYTKIGTRYYFNRPADETITVRIWYQKTHGNFTDDTTSHSFEPDNLGFQAIVATVLAELHDALPGMEISLKAEQAIQKKEYWISKLIEADMKKADEEIIMLGNTDRDTSEGEISPYSWV